MLDKSLTEFITAAPEMVREVGGFLSDREIRFLALLSVSPLGDGEILEIGSFEGKIDRRACPWRAVGRRRPDFGRRSARRRVVQDGTRHDRHESQEHRRS